MRVHTPGQRTIVLIHVLLSHSGLLRWRHHRHGRGILLDLVRGAGLPGERAHMVYMNQSYLRPAGRERHGVMSQSYLYLPIPT